MDEQVQKLENQQRKTVGILVIFSAIIIFYYYVIIQRVKAAHTSDFTGAVMWGSGAAARMELLFELRGCWTKVSLLLPAGALR